ncbi:MAG: hypothetical protein MUE85_13935 [Microscillaceae bacterium]|jgi:hypothetical protein|nr:hypothetical protein [Microscillaceae bacterium]
MKFVIEDDYNFRVYSMFNEEIFHYQYDPHYKLSIQTWKSYMLTQDVVSIYQYIAKFAFEHKQLIIGSLSDLRTLAGAFDSSNEWLMKEYMPLAIKNGFRFSATVRPEDSFADLALEEIVIMARALGYGSQYFIHYSDAYHWLIQQLDDYLPSLSTPNTKK